MGRWHADQENNMRPDVKAMPCPWCGEGSEQFIVVDTVLHKSEEFGDSWKAQAMCHECGAKSQSSDIGLFPHPLSEDYLYLDEENERDVVNFAVKVWNCRQ
ncbi:hypothetical protein QR665_14695 [Acinetobacter gerneri]|uniref:hypothetical protein n=1 Tax=Acinetobacter gerneri TaxID=202952 RepID=UPI002936763F|nr:hypothetical protein [Acinetobacter gerneri]MDV2440708.1 hypothetical protein [Acinetobacter gerneri]